MKRREAKSKGEKESYPFECRVPKNSKEIRKPSSMISTKKLRKTIEWERLEISSRILEYKGNISCKIGTIKDRKGMDLIEAQDI